MEKINNLTPSFIKFSRHENEELYISKEVKENALASEGKSCQPEKNNRSNNMRATTPQYEISGKNHLLSQNVFLQRIIYPSVKQTSLEQAAFWHEVKVLCCLPTPFSIPGGRKGFIKGEAVRLPRTNSSQITFERNIRNFQNRLIERGRSAAILRKYLSEVKFADRKTALQQRNKSARKKLLPRPLLYNTTLLYQA